MPRCFLVLLFVLIIKTATAQPYHFRHYQVESGLSNNTVICVAQDHQGFMWFGTKEGINRFDGYHFKQFRLQPDTNRTFTPDLAYDLHQDDTGTLWVGAQQGLFCYNAQSEQMIRHLPLVQEVHSIASQPDGSLWFVGNGLLHHYMPSKRTVLVYPATQTGSVSTLCLAEGGSIWIATADGSIKKIDAKGKISVSFEVFPNADASVARYIQKIYNSGDTAIYIGTNSQGIKQLQLRSGVVKNLLTYNKDHSSVYVRDIMPYDHDEIWFATESGIFIYNAVTAAFTNIKKNLSDPYSISDNAVYTLFKDAEDGVWAGTYFGGANYYAKNGYTFEKFFPADYSSSIGGSVVREICPDDFGNIWIGTEDAGLNKLNRKDGTITQFKPTGTQGSIAYTNIHGLLAVDDQLWIGTFEHGLDVMDIRSGKVIRHYNAGPGKHDLRSNFVVYFMRSSTGDIYVGTSSGLQVYNKSIDGFEQVTQVPRFFISTLVEDRHQKIWVGTHTDGLYHFNRATGKSGKFKNVDKHGASITSKINALMEDSKGAIWVATEGGGLCRLNLEQHKFDRFTKSDGLPSDFIFKVLEDEEGMIWASTSKGLAKLTQDGIKVYTKAAGLLSDQFNYNSGYADDSGKLYFGSAKGMIAFRPANNQNKDFQPPLYITGLQIQDRELEAKSDHLLQQSILFTKELTLPHNQSSFSINYSALSFAAPDMINYQYKMEGLDKDWTDLQQARRIYFTNLAPGNYTFRIRTTADNSFKPVEKAMSIRINPPWWATWWAYAFYIVGGLSLGIFLMRLYLQHIEDKKEKELYEAKINFFTNVAHEIKTPLTLIKGPVENLRDQLEEAPQIKDDVDMLERNTRRLINLITQMLDFRKTETKGFSLEFTRVNMAALIKEEWQAFAPLAMKHKLHVVLHLPQTPLYIRADEEALRKILSNLFSNAVKYAAKEISISIQPVHGEAEAVLVQVTNDGHIVDKENRERIFEPFYRLKETSKHKGTGIGLALARSLAELHSGRLFLSDQSSGHNTFVLFIPTHAAGFAAAANQTKKLLFQDHK